MGLGKTVQTLAHILVEKREGRLDRPCLVVVPDQRRAELARGGGSPRARAAGSVAARARPRAALRRDRQRRSGDHDLRAAVARRRPVCCRSHGTSPCSTKRRRSRTPMRRRRSSPAALDARHRLCLTGTPMENHLGELWSQFAFLMPGLLGDARRFAPRVPHADREEAGRRSRARCCRARLKPFLLRRTKSPGGGRAAAEDRDLCGRSSSPGRSATSTRPCASRCTRRCAREIAEQGARPQPHRRARRAAEAAPGLLRSAPRQARGGAPGRAPAPSSST